MTQVKQTTRAKPIQYKKETKITKINMQQSSFNSIKSSNSHAAEIYALLKFNKKYPTFKFVFSFI